MLSDRDDHGICGLSGSQCHAFFRGIGISVLQDEVGAFLELSHESDGVSGERGSDGGEGVVKLRGEVGTDGSEVRVGAGLESRGGEVSDRVEEGSGDCRTWRRHVISIGQVRRVDQQRENAR